MKQQRRLYTALAFVLVAALLGVLSFATLGAQQPPYDPRRDGPLPPEQIAPAPEVKTTGRVVRADKFDKLEKGWKKDDQTLSPDQMGKWEVAHGKLLQNKSAGADEQYYRTDFIAEVDTAGQASVAVQIYPQGNELAGLIFRSNRRGYYVFNVYRDDSGAPLRRALVRVEPGVGTVTLAEDTQGAGYVMSRWQELRVQLDGDHIVTFFDGQQVFDVRDSTFAKGQAGVTTLAVGNMAFDNFTVEQP
jgi:hypothetical protein